MQKLTNQENLKPWKGFVLFVITLLFLLFAGSYMQMSWGIPGLILTEIGFLVISIVYCLINKVSLKEVFPVKKITGRDFFGTLFMFAGGFLLNLVCAGISMFVLDLLGHKDALSEASALNDFLFGNQMLYILIVIVVAVTPAICEESIMRGALLSSFRGLKSDKLIIFIIGMMFGIFHLSPLRFLNTFCLGMVLAYIMVKKNNILLPMLVHFLNNFVSSIAGASSNASGEEISAAMDMVSTSMTLGSMLLAGFLCPLLLVIGAKLLDKENVKGKHFVISGILSALMLVSGIVILLVSSMNALYKDSLLNWNYTFTATEETLECDNLAESSYTFTEEGTYTFIVSATASKANITFTIEDENGDLVFSQGSTSMLVVSENLELEPGTYTFYFTSDETIVGKTFSYQVIIR